MEPKYTDDELKTKSWRRVICYLTDQGQRHSVFAGAYDKEKETFRCVNSWGKVNERPDVPKKDVYGIFYVSIVLDPHGKSKA